MGSQRCILNHWMAGAGKWDGLNNLNIEENKSEMCSSSFSSAGSWVFAHTTRTRKTLTAQSGAAVLRQPSRSGGQGCFRKMLNSATPTAWCRSYISKYREADGALVCTQRGKTKVVTGLYQDTTVGAGFSLPFKGGRTDLEDFFVWRLKLSVSFCGDCWIRSCWSAGWSFLMKGQWCDGLSRAVASAHCEIVSWGKGLAPPSLACLPLKSPPATVPLMIFLTGRENTVVCLVCFKNRFLNLPATVRRVSETQCPGLCGSTSNRKCGTSLWGHGKWQH